MPEIETLIIITISQDSRRAFVVPLENVHIIRFRGPLLKLLLLLAIRSKKTTFIRGARTTLQKEHILNVSGFEEMSREITYAGFTYLTHIKVF